MVVLPPERSPSEPVSLRSLPNTREPIAQLPAPLTSLLGREREVTAVGELLHQSGVRLVTLTGPGGVGKTRLALRVAEAVAADFPDGLSFVSLAEVREPDLIPSTIAQALGVREAGHRGLVEGIAAFLHDREALLILDNFEHLLEAAPFIAELLSHCRLLTCLITSRALLQISGEHAFPVPSLPLPPTSHTITAERAALSPAVRLFVARAQAVRPDFALTDANAEDVEVICRRLDGLPLALELAAARIRHLTPADLATRLVGGETGGALRVLTGGPRDAPDRQQTLRYAMAWSYDLLTPQEQALFRRLAVFVGGFTLEAAEAMTSPDGDTEGDIAAEIAALVDQSLLQRDEEASGASRYLMLETIREFALERLVTSGDAAAVQAAHAAYFLALAERAATELHGQQQHAWLGRLAEEQGNLRAALDWFARVGQTDELARFAWALFWFWWFRGHLAEGLDWYERALSKGADLPSPLRGSTLFGAAQCAWTLGDVARAETLAHEAQALAQMSGQSVIPGLPELMLAVIAAMRSDFTAAASLGEAALHQLRQVGGWEAGVWLRIALNDIGLHAAQAAQGARGMALIEEALALVQDGDDPFLAGVHWSDLGLAAQSNGDATKAVRCYVEGLRLLQAAGGDWYLAIPLAGLASIAITRDPLWSARLFGAAEALRERSGQPNWPLERERDEQAMATLQAILGEEQLAQNRLQGRSMPLTEILAWATTAFSRDSKSSSEGMPASANDLSPREIEVLRLLAAGCSDREIAETLFISHRTASKHVGNILAKLDVTSRGEAAVFALRLNLV
jgi:predicted ATPase/DNA-binding CsgD family transcriptional regulator